MGGRAAGRPMKPLRRRSLVPSRRAGWTAGGDSHAFPVIALSRKAARRLSLGLQACDRYGLRQSQSQSVSPSRRRRRAIALLLETFVGFDERRFTCEFDADSVTRDLDELTVLTAELDPAWSWRIQWHFQEIDVCLAANKDTSVADLHWAFYMAMAVFDADDGGLYPPGSSVYSRPSIRSMYVGGKNNDNIAGNCLLLLDY